jgi:alpha-ketoglutarate-dependent taurine dioxygenase
MNQHLPHIIEPTSAIDSANLVAFLAENRNSWRQQVVEHGALLFRGFSVPDASSFSEVCAAATPDLVAYTGGGSPRKQVEGKVYTSTEYPADQSIPLHCEESYFPDVPPNIFFYCHTEAEEQGQTPMGCMSEFLGKLDSSILEEFCERGVRYIYNLHGGNGFGRGWKDAFLTDDRDWVTNWLETRGAKYHWNHDNSLHMDLPGSALREHSVTGVTVWGNQVVNWHIDSLPPKMAQGIRRVYDSEDKFPKHATFGDGKPIPKAYIDHILEKLASIEVVFDWKQGDVLWCDNERVAHGRRPFKGKRRILVALS